MCVCGCRISGESYLIGSMTILVNEGVWICELGEEMKARNAQREQEFLARMMKERFGDDQDDNDEDDSERGSEEAEEASHQKVLEEAGTNDRGSDSGNKNDDNKDNESYSDNDKKEIKLVNNTIYSSYNSMFEIKYPNKDIGIYPYKKNQISY